MRQFWIHAACAALASAPAIAADMPFKAKAPPLAAPYNWTGFYVGANVGYSVGRDPSAFASAFFGGAESFSLQPAGAIGGGQIGYNWQTGRWVLGIEADIQASGQKDSACVTRCLVGSIGATIDQEMPWFGTVRGRIGWAEGAALFYLTGGLAYGRVNTTINFFDPPSPNDLRAFSATKTGWTLGGGIEAAIAGPWTAKVEYLYVDLGSVSGAFNFLNLAFLPHTFTSGVHDHIFRAGINYRFGQPAMAAAVAPMGAPLHNWSGVYAGVNLGYGVARDPTTFVAAGFQPQSESFKLDPAGVLGGAQVGLNWQSAHLVLGLETDIQASAQKSSPNCMLICFPVPPTPVALQMEQKLSWFGTLRGRLGWAEGPILFYATGGLAYGRVTTRDLYQNGGLIGTNLAQSLELSSTKTGWTVGGGIEGVLAGNWSAKVEYLYLDLGSQTITFPIDFGLGFTNVNTIETKFRDHVVRAGLNYRFGP